LSISFTSETRTTMPLEITTFHGPAPTSAKEAYTSVTPLFHAAPKPYRSGEKSKSSISTMDCGKSASATYEGPQYILS
jgi:hypothetical protein